jgi:hypothetical protein
MAHHQLTVLLADAPHREVASRYLRSLGYEATVKLADAWAARPDHEFALVMYRPLLGVTGQGGIMAMVAKDLASLPAALRACVDELVGKGEFAVTAQSEIVVTDAHAEAVDKMLRALAKSPLGVMLQ